MAVRDLLCRVSKEVDDQRCAREWNRRYELYFKSTTSPIGKNEFIIKLTPAQREAIVNLPRDSRLPPNGYLGHAVVVVDPEAREIEWNGFYPLGKPSPEMPIPDSVKRLGIGTRVHHKGTEDLAANFPNYRILHGAFIENERLGHLGAMDIKPHVAYPIKVYRDKVRDYMRTAKQRGK